MPNELQIQCTQSQRRYMRAIASAESFRDGKDTESEARPERFVSATAPAPPRGGNEL